MKTQLRKTLVILGGILLCGVLGVVFIRTVLVGKVASDDELRALFAQHRTEIETLKRMFLEDAKKSHRLRFVVGRSAYIARQDGIAADRFAVYSELMKKVGIQSMHGDEDGVNFPMTRIGWAGEGLAKGLGWSRTPVTDVKEKGVEQRFVPLEDGWYIFEFHVH